MQSIIHGTVKYAFLQAEVKSVIEVWCLKGNNPKQAYLPTLANLKYQFRRPLTLWFLTSSLLGVFVFFAGQLSFSLPAVTCVSYHSEAKLLVWKVLFFFAKDRNDWRKQNVGYISLWEEQHNFKKETSPSQTAKSIHINTNKFYLKLTGNLIKKEKQTF